MIGEYSDTTTSDSEIDSQIKLNLRTDACLICQKTGNLVGGSKKTYERITKCLELREKFTEKKYLRLQQILETSGREGNFESLIWHKKCYSSFTSKLNLDHLRKNYENREKCELSEPNIADELNFENMSLRKVTFDNNKCVFCQKRNLRKKLSQVLTKNSENKIRAIAANNSSVLKRIGSIDLIAAEIKYHANCLTMEWKNYVRATTTSTEAPVCKTDQGDFHINIILKQLEKGLSKGKGFTVTSTYNRYLELGGSHSKKKFVKLIKDEFKDTIEFVHSDNVRKSYIIMPKVTKAKTVHSHIEETSKIDDNDTLKINIGDSELSQIHKICDDIKTQMCKIPDFKNYKNLDISFYKDFIPESLIWLISLLTGGNKDDTEVVSVCQDLIYLHSKKKKLTPKHIGLGLTIHQETKSKKLIETLHTCGHCVSYKEILRLRNSIAQDEINRYMENENTVIPRQLVPNRFVQFAADNIDILEETLDKAPTFHATQMVAFQRGPPEESFEPVFQLLPYKVKLNIPENFHLLRKSFFNKSIKPTPDVNKEKFEEKLEKDEISTNYIRGHNMAWILCRISESNADHCVIPQWSGFNKLLPQKENAVTLYGYLPLLPYVASDYDTVWTVMKRCDNIANKLNIRHPVITFDQAIYFKAKEIQWSKGEECKQYVIRLGGFHIMLNFLKVIGQHMCNSGLRDVWLESGLYGEATIEGILSGKKWNKGIRAHKLTYESLMRPMIQMFEKWLVDCKNDSIHIINLARLQSADFCDDVRNNRTPENFKHIANTCEQIEASFTEFVSLQSPTFRFWYSYIELIEILLEFLYAERTANWQLHIQSLRKMIPWFFAHDHVNYSRWGSVYLADMLNLPTQAPDVYNEFMKGNFVVQRLPGKFNSLSVDQALEHVNKSSKDAGGIVGITKNSTRLDEWFLSYNEIGLMTDTFKNSLNIKSNPESQNIEMGSKRIVVDEESVVKLQEQFMKFNVFTKSDENLMCISTNEVINKDVEKIWLTKAQIGEEAFKKFINNLDTQEFYKPLKKLNLSSMNISKNNNVRFKKKDEWQKGQECLQRILAAKEMGRNISYSDLFSHEMSPFPMALAPHGSLGIPSNKSALGNIIETFTTSVSNLPESALQTCHIFDGMSIVQKLGKPTNAKTFGDYAKIYNSVIFKNEHNASRIDLVLDHYNEDSIKTCARVKRSTSDKSIKRKIEASNASLPQQWSLFIHSTYNKNQLTNFLSEQATTHAENLKTVFVTSGGFSDVLRYTANAPLNEAIILKSNHEEADTRIILHILSAKLNGIDRCIIECSDTDVLVLLAHFKDKLTSEVWMKVGCRNNRRFIAVHQINMEPLLLKNLPAFHAFTGCDTVSQFVGLGKKSCWKTFLEHSALLDGVGTEQFNEGLFERMHKFTIKLYTNNDDITCINNLRGLLATSKTIDKLPPTKDSLKLHCLRAVYQATIWYNSLESQPALPNVTEYGWTLVDNKVTPILSTLPPFPKNIDAVSSCGCKKDCRPKTCSCKKNNISCIGSCRCMGQKSCKNASKIIPSSDEYIISEDSESE